MKILAIMGSPHGAKGTAGPIVNRMMEAVQDGGAEAEIISLADYKLQPCKGCRMCAKTGQCVIKDDYAGIKEKLLETDGIILVSPNYMHNVSAQMKAFLDRSFSRGPYVKGELRIDPAPRWNRTSDAVLIPHFTEDGTRQMFILHVK